ncbi:MAG: YigZ family protein [Oscillospiraceae bacterium]|nr:YigZ family protein [Oscillospiraceae bacterium]
MKPYLSPAKTGEAVFCERGSRFVGVCAAVPDEDGAREFIGEIRRKHPGASHNVYAYRLRDGAERLSDDGEPSGTAGSPVFGVLARRDLVNAVIVVTRYFGGTLLGAGGLVRAYAKSAAAALDAAGVAEWTLWREGMITVPYPLYERVNRLLEGAGARNTGSEFGENVSVKFQVSGESWEPLCAVLRELTGGDAPGTLRTLYRP